MNDTVKLTPFIIRQAEIVLSKGDRVELVPIKNGEVKVLRVRRDAVQLKNQGNR